MAAANPSDDGLVASENLTLHPGADAGASAIASAEPLAGLLVGPQSEPLAKAILELQTKQAELRAEKKNELPRICEMPCGKNDVSKPMPDNSPTRISWQF